jgi:hypothetical protein
MDAKLTKLVIMSLLFAGPLLTPNHVNAADVYKNFQSLNFQDRFIRHRDFLIYLEPVRSGPALNDAAFNVVPGLAGSCNSFESRNFPNFYIRHQNLRLKLNKFENEALFRKDATFCIRQGLAIQQTAPLNRSITPAASCGTRISSFIFNPTMAAISSKKTPPSS